MEIPLLLTLPSSTNNFRTMSMGDEPLVFPLKRRLGNETVRGELRVQLEWQVGQGQGQGQGRGQELEQGQGQGVGGWTMIQCWANYGSSWSGRAGGGPGAGRGRGGPAELSRGRHGGRGGLTGLYRQGQGSTHTGGGPPHHTAGQGGGACALTCEGGGACVLTCLTMPLWPVS